MKRCRTCGENKPLTDYYMFKKRESYFSDCKRCNIKDVTANTKLKKEAMQQGKKMDYYIILDDKIKISYSSKMSVAGAARRYKTLGRKVTMHEEKK